MSHWYPGGAGSNYASDGYAATADGLIATTSPVTGPDGREAIRLRVIDADTGTIAATARLGMSPVGLSGSGSTVTAVAASPLTPGPALILVRRVDVKGNPLLALSVPLPKDG